MPCLVTGLIFTPCLPARLQRDVTAGPPATGTITLNRQ
jgi:hypothetical protein